MWKSEAVPLSHQFQSSVWAWDVCIATGPVGSLSMCSPSIFSWNNIKDSMQNNAVQILHTAYSLQSTHNHFTAISLSTLHAMIKRMHAHNHDQLCSTLRSSFSTCFDFFKYLWSNIQNSSLQCINKISIKLLSISPPTCTFSYKIRCRGVCVILLLASLSFFYTQVWHLPS